MKCFCERRSFYNISLLLSRYIQFCKSWIQLGNCDKFIFTFYLSSLMLSDKYYFIFMMVLQWRFGSNYKICLFRCFSILAVKYLGDGLL